MDVSYHFVAHASDSDILVLVVVGRLPLEPGADGGHLGLRLFQRDVRLQPPDHAVVMRRPRFGFLEGRGGEPDIGLLGEVESARQHAYDAERLIQHPYGLAKRPRIAAEVALPKRVADENRGCATRFLLLGCERTTQHRLHAEEPKEL